MIDNINFVSAFKKQYNLNYNIYTECIFCFFKGLNYGIDFKGGR